MADSAVIREVDWMASTANVAKYLGPSFTGVIRDVENDIIYIRNGWWHREDGPALVGADNHKEFYLDGQFYLFEEWLNTIGADEVMKTYYRVVYG